MFYPTSRSGPSDTCTEGWTFLNFLNYFHFFVRSIIFRGHQQLNKRISSEATREMDGSLQPFRSPKNCHQQQFTACVQESISFAWGLLQSLVISPQKNKSRGRCLHMLKSWSFIKYYKQRRFTLDREEGCISLVPAASLGEHAPSIRSLSWLTDWWGKGQGDVTIAMPSAALPTPSSLSFTALGKQALEIKPASAAVHILSSGNMKMNSDVVFKQQKQ